MGSVLSRNEVEWSIANYGGFQKILQFKQRLTIKENQTSRRLISFNVSGIPFASGIIAKSDSLSDLAKKQPIAVQALTVFKKIERRHARFS